MGSTETKTLQSILQAIIDQGNLTVTEVNTSVATGTQSLEVVKNLKLQELVGATATHVITLDAKAQELIQLINEQGLRVRINQAGHGFTFTAVQFDKTANKYVKATTETTADAMAIKVNDNFFDLVASGSYDIPEGVVDSSGNPLVVDEYYFLDQTQAGGFTPVKPIHIFQPLFLVAMYKDKMVAYIDVDTAVDLEPRILVDEIDSLGLATTDQVALAEPTIASLVASTKYNVGDVVEVLGYYSAGDGAGHPRIIAQADDGSGILLDNGLYANLVHNGEINVLFLGAKGDELFDNTDVFNKAFSYAKTIYIPEGTYNMLGQISGLVNNIYGDGIDKTIIKSIGNKTVAIEIENQDYYKLVGRISSAITLPNTKEISIADTTGLSKGDYIAIMDDDNNSWSGFREYYKKGQILSIDKIEAGKITTKEIIRDYYKLSNVNIYKMNYINGLTIRDIAIVSEDNLTSFILHIQGYNNIDISNIRTVGSKYSNIAIEKCINVNIDSIESIIDIDNATGNNYSLSIGNTQTAFISNSYMKSIRHSITVGGDASPINPPCRDIIVSNCNLICNGEYGALDLHGNSQGCLYTDNIVDGGIIVAGQDNIIQNNMIYQGTCTSAIYFSEVSRPDLHILGNTIYASDTTVSRASAIDIGGNGNPILTGSTKDLGKIIIKDNVIKTMVISDTQSFEAIRIYTSDTAHNHDLVIDNNILINDVHSLYKVAGNIFISQRNNAKWGSIIITNNSIKNGNIDSRYCVNAVCSNNIVDMSEYPTDLARSGIAIQYVDNSSVLNNNTVISASTYGIHTSGNNIGNSLANVSNNTVKNWNTSNATSTVNQSGIYVSRFGRISFNGNVIHRELAGTAYALNVGSDTLTAEIFLGINDIILENARGTTRQFGLRRTGTTTLIDYFTFT